MHTGHRQCCLTLLRKMIHAHRTQAVLSDPTPQDDSRTPGTARHAVWPNSSRWFTHTGHRQCCLTLLRKMILAHRAQLGSAVWHNSSRWFTHTGHRQCCLTLLHQMIHAHRAQDDSTGMIHEHSLTLLRKMIHARRAQAVLSDPTLPDDSCTPGTGSAVWPYSTRLFNHTGHMQAVLFDHTPPDDAGAPRVKLAGRTFSGIGKWLALVRGLTVGNHCSIGSLHMIFPTECYYCVCFIFKWILYYQLASQRIII